jgi:hypothetical protein
MNKQKKSEKNNTYFNKKSKDQHKQDVRVANEIEYSLQRIGYLHKITLCDY